MKTIPIKIPAGAAQAYEVRVGAGLLAGLGEMVRAVAPSPSAAVITDSNVAPLYLGAVRGSLEGAGYRVISHVVPAGETNKTLATAALAMEVLLRSKVERGTPVVALGGGVVGDLAGFVAATILRGVPLVQVPTTLLAAVDASVGGKVAVDHPAGKNLIGAFHQPRLVVTDLDTFATLPAAEVQGGLAECIKHAVIRDAELFDFIGGNLAAIGGREVGVMGELVARNVAIKAAIVEADPFEKGVRGLLNLGHTFGHAIEAVTGYGVSHGQGVGLGMMAACYVAEGRGSFAAGDVRRVRGLLEAAGLPVAMALDAAEILAAMGTDKKIVGGRIRLILPTRIGDAEIVADAAEGEILAAVRRLAAEQ